MSGMIMLSASYMRDASREKAVSRRAIQHATDAISHSLQPSVSTTFQDTSKNILSILEMCQDTMESDQFITNFTDCMLYQLSGD
jgi:hypothetical protein